MTVTKKTYKSLNVQMLASLWIFIIQIILSFIHDRLTNTSNKERSLPRFYFLPQNLEEMFPRYYVDSDVVSIFKYPFIHWFVTQREKVNLLITH